MEKQQGSRAAPASESGSGSGEVTAAGRKVVLAVCASVFFSVLNASIVNVTLPTIGRDLEVDPGQLGWIITAYLLVYGVAIPFYGRLADLHGARRYFLFGQGVFALGSLLCALAPNYPLLLGARILQAAGGAAIPGLGVALAGRAYPPNQRGAALGLISTTVGAAGAIGPTLGGVVSDALGWHFVFAIGALAGLLVPLNRRILPDDEGRGGSGLDLRGGVFLAMTIAGSLFAATEGARSGWGSPRVIWGAATATVGLIALILRQRTAASPFIPRELLSNRRYLAVSATSFAAMTAFLGPLVGLPLLLTSINGLSPSQVGLVLLPSAVLNAALGIFVGRLVDRVGARIPVRVGLGVMLIGVLGLSSAVGASPWVVAALIALLGIGVAFVNTPLSTAVSLVVPPERIPSGQSINTMLFFLGGSFGTTLVTAVVSARGQAAEAFNPLHVGVGVGFSDAFLFLAAAPVLALAVSAALPAKPTADSRVDGRIPSAASPRPAETTQPSRNRHGENAPRTS